MASLFGKFGGKIFGAAKSLFARKNKPPKTFGRPEEQAKIAFAGQAGRREKLLKLRVRKGREKLPAHDIAVSGEGTSEKVYKNKKLNAEIAYYVGDKKFTGSATREEFLLGHPLIRFASSNVWALVYDKKTEHLYVQYMAGKGRKKSGPGRWYKYASVSIDEARIAYNTASKGVFSWSYLRLRGSQTANRKPTSRDTPPPAHLPYEE